MEKVIKALSWVLSAVFICTVYKYMIHDELETLGMEMKNFEIEKW